MASNLNAEKFVVVRSIEGREIVQKGTYDRRAAERFASELNADALRSGLPAYASIRAI